MQDIDNLRNFLIEREKWFSISYMNDIVLNLPNKRLTNFMKKTKYQEGLGDYEDKVFVFFKGLGYDEKVSYEQFL
jgi:hypothetical protein